MNFPESFLHFIWQFRLFKAMNLLSATGECIRILNPGVLNKNAGPDFTKVRLVIGDTTWVGDVEIHLKSSDWILHGHQNDAAYNTVVLHVVYQHDRKIHRADGSSIPVLILEHLFPDELLNNYHQLVDSLNRIPCEKQLHSVPAVIVNGFLSRLLVTRLEEKSAAVLDKLSRLKGDWDATFYYFLAKSFGFKVNEVPFELLAASLPHQLIAKHIDNTMQVEALFFGQAGFLSEPLSDEYPQQLKREYAFLQRKYHLKPVELSAWKFLRMRPQNFPTIRLAQLCAVLLKSKRLLSIVLEEEELSVMVKLLQDLPVNPYWQTHYHFQKSTAKVNMQLGMQSIHHLIMNVICLFLYAYGRYTDQPRLIDRALYFLEQLPAESNSIISCYRDSGLTLKTAFFSQALLQLNKYYCTQKKCLNCVIGIKILNR